MSNRARDNLQRLVAVAGMPIHQVARLSGLDQRTVRGILNGVKKPHAHTLNRLAKGLGVSVNEFFIEPTQLLYRRFDRATNPLVAEVMADNPKLFADWTEADFDELHSRMGTGGPLTREGTLDAVQAMNRKRDLHEKLDLILESTQADLAGEILDVLYNKIAVV